VKLWTIKTNECIATYDKHDGKVCYVALLFIIYNLYDITLASFLLYVASIVLCCIDN
jgi:hypothetical protein